MGNNLCVETAHNLESCPSATNTAEHNYLKVWSVSSPDADPEPISMLSFHSFYDSKCYLILHVCNDILSEQAQEETETHEPPSTQQRSLLNLVHSSIDNLTPRGLEHVFKTVDNKYSIYLWNGKETTPELRQHASRHALALQRTLAEGNAPMDVGELTPLTSIFSNDLPPPPKETPRPQHAAIYRNNLLRMYINGASVRRGVPISQAAPIKTPLNLSIPPGKFNAAQKMQMEGLSLGFDTRKSNGDEDDDDNDENNTNTESGSMTASSVSDDESDSESLEDRAPLSSSRAPPVLHTSRVSLGGIRFPQPADPRSNSSRGKAPAIGKIALEGLAQITSTEPHTTSSRDRSHCSQKNSTDERLPPVSARGGDMLNGAQLAHICAPICSKIEDFLYLGSVQVARNKEELLKHDIRYVINTARVVLDNYFEDDPQFHYLSWKLYDQGSLSLIGIFYKSIEFIEHARELGESVFIHCEKGVSRSSTVTIAYHMWKYESLRDASLRHVKEGRMCVSPNPGFLVQLKEWERMLYEKPVPRLFRMAPVSRDYPQVIPKMCNARTVDSRTTFVLAGDNGLLYVWIGSQSDSHLTEHASHLAERMQRYHSGVYKEVHQVLEGEEPKEFDAQLSRVEGFLKDFTEAYNDLDVLSSISVSGSDSEDTMGENGVGSQGESQGSETYDGVLYELTADGYEDMGTFDSEDLFSDGVYLLVPAEGTPGAGTVFVWVGLEVSLDGYSDLEEFAEHHASQLREQFDLNCNDVVAIREDEEVEEFFDYFYDVE